MTPLLAATRDSWHGRPEAVMTLLANGADPRASRQRRQHAAAPRRAQFRSGRRRAAARCGGRTRRAQRRRPDPARHRLRLPATGGWRGSCSSAAPRPKPAGATPALLAAAGGEEDDPAGVQLLLKHKAKVDARDAQGRSALHEAALAGHDDVAGGLAGGRRRRAGARRARAARRCSTPRAAAACRRSKRLLDAGADVGLRRRRWQQRARAGQPGADAPSPALLRRLLDLGIDPDQVDRDGKRAVEHAADAGRWALVAMLDPAYPLPSQRRRRQPRPPRRRTARRCRCCAKAWATAVSIGLDSLARLLSPR